MSLMRSLVNMKTEKLPLSKTCIINIFKTYIINIFKTCIMNILKTHIINIWSIQNHIVFFVNMFPQTSAKKFPPEGYLGKEVSPRRVPRQRSFPKPRQRSFPKPRQRSFQDFSFIDISHFSISGSIIVIWVKSYYPTHFSLALL